MYKFHAEEWFEIKKRGPVACIDGQWLIDHPEIYDPDTLRGQTVDIDGKTYIVRGVETFLIPRSKERPYSNDFSLLVEPVA